MKLVELTVKDYIDLLGSDAPAPGGGSASALSGAQGAGLAAMVAALTIGKKKYQEYWELCEEKQAAAADYQKRLAAQVDKDTEAFNLLSSAFKLPKETDDEKKLRSGEIASATLIATQVPFDTLVMAVEALEVAQEIVGRSNSNAASDLGVAALQLLACARGAWLNVLINLPGVKDEEKAAFFKTKGAEYMKKAESGSEEIYKATLEIISA